MADSLFEALGFERMEAYNYIVYTKTTQSIIFNLRDKRVEFGFNILNAEELQAVTKKSIGLKWFE